MTTTPPALLDGRTKGLPAGTRPLTRDDIARAKWNVLAEDLPLPVAVLKDSSLRHNSAWMRSFRRMTGVDIAPHGKTTMSPELYARQLDDGAWGITVATVQQLRVCREHGIERVLLANQLIGKQAIAYVLDELGRDPEFEFCCLVDSVAGVEMLERAIRESQSGSRGNPRSGSNFATATESTRATAQAKFEPGPVRAINVFLECGAVGARTGCRTLDEAVSVARRIAQAKPHLRLIGIEGFEGAIHGATPAETEARITDFVAFIGRLAQHCAEENLIDADPIILSAGGSAYFDIVTRLPRSFNGRSAKVIIRSGCYLTHDSDSYAKAARRMRERMPEIATLGDGLRDAIEVWSYVQSLPEPGLAILTMGKRDVSYDQHLPFPRWTFRPGTADAKPAALTDNFTIKALNDQHAFMSIPADANLEVGDMIGCTIAHPCTTFDKWRFMPIVDDAYNVIDAITTYF